ncbi:MAG: hypothetical protein ACOYK1_09665 [Vampirovibrionia bacterium]
MASADKKSKEISPIMKIFSSQSMSYKRGSFNYEANSELIIDMLLNNMKIEGQEVDKDEFLGLLNERNAS